MSMLARSLLFGLAFVAALAAVLLGLRRRRVAAVAVRPGPFSALRKAFWAAAGVLLGVAPGCDDGESKPDADAEAGRDEGFWVECYIAPADGFEDFGAFDADQADEDVLGEDVGIDCCEEEDAGDSPVDVDAGAGEADVGPDAGPDASPDAGPGDVASADGAGEAAKVAGAPMSSFAGPKPAGETRRERWIRRTLLRAEAVEQLLADPETHPAVRAALRRDLRALRARVRRLREG